MIKCANFERCGFLVTNLKTGAGLIMSEHCCEMCSKNPDQHGFRCAKRKPTAEAPHFRSAPADAPVPLGLIQADLAEAATAEQHEANALMIHQRMEEDSHRYYEQRDAELREELKNYELAARQLMAAATITPQITETASPPLQGSNEPTDDLPPPHEEGPGS